MDPRMEDILSQSYGVITYQDDVLLIAIKIAGYSWLEADKLRKAMGKKIPEVMAAEEEKFVSGAVDHGLSAEKALELWKLIEPFAAYGFNKAHAASYGRVAYQTAYMKANFPIEYMTAVLSAESGDIDKISETITECKRMGIPVLPPDVNESFGGFTVIKNGKGAPEKIRFGLYTVKNLGTDISDAIINERETAGRFLSFSDFLKRITHKNLNKKSLEALVKCGALDNFGERGKMLGNMEVALDYNKKKMENSAQNSLFGGMGKDSGVKEDLRLKETDAATEADKLLWEKELLGLYVSGHPLDKHAEKLKNNRSIKKVKEEARDGMIVVVSGIVLESKPIATKKGDRMAFLKIADKEDRVEVVVFPKTFEQFKGLLEKDKCLSVKGKISKRNDEISILADAIKEL